MKFKATPIKLVFEILGQRPSAVIRIIFGENRFQLLEQKKVTKALINGFSLLRWADGETALARGKSIGYQEENSELSTRLRECITKESEKTLIGIPPANFESVFNGQWTFRRLRIMFSTRVFLARKLNPKSQNYCSTFYWYDLYSELPQMLIKIKKRRPCLLVTGNAEFLKVTPSGTELLQTPSADAYSLHEKIESRIDLWLEKNMRELQSIKPLILLACGPYSKVICHKYSDRAQTIDVGHGFNFYLSGEAKFSWEN